jgi:predicted PilT family ATPase
VLGFSNIFADALSMGVGEYLSSQAHNEYVLAEKRREEWELQNHREGEISEMVSTIACIIETLLVLSAFIRWRSTACRKRCAYMPHLYLL